MAKKARYAFLALLNLSTCFYRLNFGFDVKK
jgi:hypothetical protein